MPGNLRVVSRRQELPNKGGMASGPVLEYLPPGETATPEEEEAVRLYFERDRARSLPGWTYFNE